MPPPLPLPPLWNRNIDSGWVEFKSGPDLIRGYLAAPKTGESLPAVIMVHENLGVIEHRQDVTRRLADLGYVALTVDLYSRLGGRSPQDFSTPEERRRKAFLAASDEQAIADLDAGLDYLETLDKVDKTRFGALGYCMGGGTEVAWVCGQTDRIKAAVALYPNAVVPGEWRPDGKALSRAPVAHMLSCPLQVHYGENDSAVPRTAQDALEEALKQADRPVEFYRHPGADHAYHDDTHPNYHRETATTSWDLAMRFFERYL